MPVEQDKTFQYPLENIITIKVFVKYCLLFPLASYKKSVNYLNECRIWKICIKKATQLTRNINIYGLLSLLLWRHKSVSQLKRSSKRHIEKKRFFFLKQQINFHSKGILLECSRKAQITTSTSAHYSFRSVFQSVFPKQSSVSLTFFVC